MTTGKLIILFVLFAGMPTLGLPILGLGRHTGEQYTVQTKEQYEATVAANREQAAANRVYAARALIRSMMRDPASARFQDVSDGRNGVICGYVNARNGFGGYTGMTRFIVSKQGRPSVQSDDDVEFVRIWNRECTG